MIEAMKASPLFEGIAEDEISALIRCFSIRTVNCRKGEFLLHQGEVSRGIGLVTDGRIHIIREDFLGAREILAEAGSGEIFGEVYALLDDEIQGTAVVAASDCQAAFLSAEKLLEPCSESCLFHQKLMGNMMRVLARKNLLLTGKISHLTRKTIREKLISYLSAERIRQQSMEITIPFNRQQLADYLSVERSALSRELSRMKEEGLISYSKNRFLLYNLN